uniref:Uncharacterized protein n=1 Tax=Anguilla anguilla TaxID=7936 RepID=A0A0E9PWX7_ANGAN
MFIVLIALWNSVERHCCPLKDVCSNAVFSKILNVQCCSVVHNSVWFAL